jgi:hypothetical protein
MPDKQNDSKIMAMLERRGIVRKVDSETDQTDTMTGSGVSREEMDLRSLLGQPAREPSVVTPAARQPVPGMPNPVISGGLPREYTREQQSPAVRREQVERTEGSQFPGGIESLTESTEWEEDSRPVQGATQSGDYSRQPAERYIDQYLEIDELYDALSLKSKRTETIYLIEEYLKTLPDSLPDESRREIVGKIIVASGFDFDILMGDGVLRVKMLKEYAERFALQTDDYVSARQSELDELEQQILRVRKMIENRRELHKKQFFTIESEAQRLREILTFISG